MLDGAMRKLIDRPLNLSGKVLAGFGLTANALTAAGLMLGLLSAAVIAIGEPQIALVPLLLSRFADGLDGAVARATRKTDFGGYFDIVADFLFYGAIPAGFAAADPSSNALAAAILLLAFYFNGASFLGYAVLAAKRGLENETRGEKSLYFAEGLLEGTETILFFIIICIWPQTFPLLAVLFGAATFYTGAASVWRAYRNFSPMPDETNHT